MLEPYHVCHHKIDIESWFSRNKFNEREQNTDTHTHSHDYHKTKFSCIPILFLRKFFEKQSVNWNTGQKNDHKNKIVPKTIQRASHRHSIQVRECSNQTSILIIAPFNNLLFFLCVQFFFLVKHILLITVYRREWKRNTIPIFYIDIKRLNRKEEKKRHADFTKTSESSTKSIQIWKFWIFFGDVLTVICVAMINLKNT